MALTPEEIQSKRTALINYLDNEYDPVLIAQFLKQNKRQMRQLSR